MTTDGKTRLNYYKTKKILQAIADGSITLADTDHVQTLLHRVGMTKEDAERIGIGDLFSD